MHFQVKSRTLHRPVFRLEDMELYLKEDLHEVVEQRVPFLFACDTPVQPDTKRSNDLIFHRSRKYKVNGGESENFGSPFFFLPATENLMTHQLLSSHGRIAAKSVTVKTTTSRHNGRDVQYVFFFFFPALAGN